MKNQLKALITFLLLSCAVTSSAQLLEFERQLITPQVKNTAANANEDEGFWWGYYKDNFESGSLRTLGMGSDYDLPLHYDCAIKLEVNNTELRNKIIKAIKFAFVYTDFIDNISVWISDNLPLNPKDANICYLPLDKKDIKSLNVDGEVNAIYLPEQYNIYDKDVYVGYSFDVTSFKDDLCTYPIVCSGDYTDANAFLLNIGTGWKDFKGQSYGNIAMNILIDENTEIITGDANYDGKVNVVDVSYTLNYILKGDNKSFNFKAADVNGDGEINIVDVESIIDIILELYKAPTENNSAEPEDVLVTQKNDVGMGVSISGNNSYRGFQMDLVLPEGRSISSVVADKSISATHNIMFSKISDGRYRIIAHSINGSCLAENVDKLIDIYADTDDIKFENIIFVTPGLMARHLNSVGSDVNGIDVISAEKNNGEI